MPANAARSHLAMENIVKSVRKRYTIRTMTILIAPKEIVTEKLENNTIRLCTANIITMALGFVCMTHRTANS